MTGTFQSCELARSLAIDWQEILAPYQELPFGFFHREPELLLPTQAHVTSAEDPLLTMGIQLMLLYHHLLWKVRQSGRRKIMFTFPTFSSNTSLNPLELPRTQETTGITIPRANQRRRKQQKDN
ncbi:unnamed protein product [Pleuronectes platessa]|uniref:Uncharacterized protein n=1 Tax=Pleuronectes platessa TaxID=8262 RepID=A0A9N7UJF1_PLEPL|nr:unnamed protein product [Pleuronectes platessa]